VAHMLTRYAQVIV